MLPTKDSDCRFEQVVLDGVEAEVVLVARRPIPWWLRQDRELLARMRRRLEDEAEVLLRVNDARRGERWRVVFPSSGEPRAIRVN